MIQGDGLMNANPITFVINYIWLLGGSRKIYLTFNNHCVLVFSSKDPQ